LAQINVKAAHGNTGQDGGVVSCDGGYRFHDGCAERVDVKK
jgi:hypothetical protein